MNMLAEMKDNRVLTVADYEARIMLYKEQIGTGYIGIGRTLLEAKKSGTIPHGQWESWVTGVTGLSMRQAQRCMQAAIEIREGSAMARLEMSKALMLLSSGLDEDQREEIAGKAADGGETVKELKEEIRQTKLRLVQESGAAAEIREALKNAKTEAEQLRQQMSAQLDAFNQARQEAADQAYRRGSEDAEEEARRKARLEQSDMLGQIGKLNSEIRLLQRELDVSKRHRRQSRSARSVSWR